MKPRLLRSLILPTLLKLKNVCVQRGARRRADGQLQSSVPILLMCAGTTRQRLLLRFEEVNCSLADFFVILISNVSPDKPELQDKTCN
jgi:hypothetical protein